MAEREDIVRDQDGFEMPDVHSSSREYAERFSGAVGRWFLSVQKEATLELLPETDLFILDAGGGHGQNIDLLRDRQGRATILGSKASCADLIEAALNHDSINFVVGPLTKIPFADHHFDASMSYRMLTHLVDWQVHIAELCRVSRSTVLVEFPVKKGFNAFSSWLFGVKKNIEKNTRPYTLFDETEIVEQFRLQGYVLSARRAEFFWPMALHRLLKNSHLSQAFEWVPKMTGLTRIWGTPVIARFDRRVN